MVDSANNIILSGRALYRDNQILSNLKDASEGGCGALGLISNIKVKGKHIYQPSVQMQNRGNGKGGGIAAAGLDPDYLGISNQVLKENYLLMVAFTDTSVMEELEQNFITPFFDIADARVWETKGDYRDLGLTIKPPEVKRYFVRVKPVLLKKFMTDLPGISARDAEDEFVWRNSYKINDSFYAGTDKRAFVLSHARDLAILKIVGYAENVIQYYGLEEMPANIWLSHQRYPTRGMVWHPGGSHPFIGMNQALIHNGGFANYHPMTEYLIQRNLKPQFITDTEVSVMLFDLWSRIYKYPLEYVVEAFAPTTELDFDKLPEAKQKIYESIQRTHLHASPDGPWFFVIAETDPDSQRNRLIGMGDPSILRPQVYAMYDGQVQIGLCASEKQIIDATLKSLHEEDKRFCPVADKYWTARGGSHDNGGAFVFEISSDGNSTSLICSDKFGNKISVPDGVDFNSDEPDNDISPTAVISDDMFISENIDVLFSKIIQVVVAEHYNILKDICRTIVRFGINGSPHKSLDLLAMLLNRRYDIGNKKHSSVRYIIGAAINNWLDASPLLNELEK